MNRQESTGKRSPPAWADIRRKLAQTDLDYVIGVVKALFDFSKENRTFLASRLFPETDWSALLEKYRRVPGGEFRGHNKRLWMAAHLTRPAWNARMVEMMLKLHGTADG
jgi:hypothetical protein